VIGFWNKKHDKPIPWVGIINGEGKNLDKFFKIKLGKLVVCECVSPYF
jgi:hypothetical protein